MKDTTSKYVIVAVTKISGTKMPSVKMNDESVRKYIRMLSYTKRTAVRACTGTY